MRSLFASRSPAFYLSIIVGILAGIGINYLGASINEQIHQYLSVVENIRYKTDVQQPVVKAFRLKEYYKYNGRLFMKFEFIKIRECNAPISISFTYTDAEGNAKALTTYDVLDRDGNPIDNPRKALVDPEHWQESSWFVIDYKEYINIFISTTHACNLKFYDETKELPKGEDVATAIDIVTKVYGPFYIGRPLEKDLRLSNIDGYNNRYRVSTQNSPKFGAFQQNEYSMEVPLPVLRGLSER